MARKKKEPEAPPVEVLDDVEDMGVVAVVDVVRQYEIRSHVVDGEVKYDWVSADTGEDSFVLFDSIADAEIDIRQQ